MRSLGRSMIRHKFGRTSSEKTSVRLNEWETGQQPSRLAKDIFPARPFSSFSPLKNCRRRHQCLLHARMNKLTICGEGRERGTRIRNTWKLARLFSASREDWERVRIPLQEGCHLLVFVTKHRRESHEYLFVGAKIGHFPWMLIRTEVRFIFGVKWDQAKIDHKAKMTIFPK